MEKKKKHKQTPPPLRSKSKACLRLKLDQDKTEAPCSDLVTRNNIGLQGVGQECGERPQWRHRHARMGWKLRGDLEHRTGLWRPSSGSGLKGTAAYERLCARGVTEHPGAGQLPSGLTQLPHLHSCANSFSEEEEEACPFPGTNYFSLYCSSVYDVWHSIKNYYTHNVRENKALSIDKAINRARLRDDLDVGAIRWTSTVLNMDPIGKNGHHS